eukprot:1143932-Pelagomonas_calceolata.AAC.7
MRSLNLLPAALLFGHRYHAPYEPPLLPLRALSRAGWKKWLSRKVWRQVKIRFALQQWCRRGGSFACGSAAAVVGVVLSLGDTCYQK